MYGVKHETELYRPAENFGDFATNIALKIAQKNGQSARDIALKIIENLQQDQPTEVQEITVAGPGFINFSLTDKALEALSQTAKITSFVGQKVVIETNNPNPFKDIHIGHAFNAVVADTIANLLERGGAEVHRVSYHGDVGLHVGMSLWAIFHHYGDKALEELSYISPEEAPEKLRDWYAFGAGMYQEEPACREDIEELAKQSFSPKGVTGQIYQVCKEWSFTYFDEVFKRLNNRPAERRYLESQADQSGRQVVEENIPKVFEESGGAIIFRGEKYGLHTRVFISKRDTTLYEARDLGLMRLKANDYAPDKSYIITATEQKEYFNVVLKAAELAMPDLRTVTVNIPTGTVKLSTGKMSSRTGEVVTIEWLFDQIRTRVTALSKDPAIIDQTEVGATRYALLKTRLDSDVIFDLNQSVSLEGNTGPYLQYAHARACSILKKAEDSSSTLLNVPLEPAERSLLRKFSEYTDALQKACQELMPHYICTYLYELAQGFNRFYEQNRVLDDPRQEVRLALVVRYQAILKDGLSLLGIPTPEQM